MYYQMILVLCIHAFLCSSCNSSTKKANNTTEAIILFFEPHKKINDIYKINDGMSYKTFKPEISYYDNFRFKECYTEKNESTDTILIYLKKEYVILRHRFDALNYYEYLFKKGDTVLFKYKNGRPFPSVLNRKTLPYDLIYDETFSNLHYKDQATPIFKYLSADLFLNYSRNASEIKKQIISFRQNVYGQADSLFNSEAGFLDSLKNNLLISSDVYEFYKNRAHNLSLLLDFKESRLPLSQVTSILQNDTTSSRVFPNHYYHLFLNEVADKLLAEKASILDLKDGFNKDYREIYNAIQNSLLLTPESKNYLLTREIGRIAKSFSKNDFQLYFKNYEAEVKDTVMVNYIKEENFLAVENISKHSENYLITNAETSDFINKYKITTIPRYMIFDKKGNLSYTHAMTPESKDLIK